MFQSKPFLNPRSFLLLLVLLAGSIFHGNSQVTDDFENTNIGLYGWQGDGTVSLNNTNGLPGKCLQLDDNPTGLGNYIVLPQRFYGDWSIAGPNDSLTMDMFAHLYDGTPQAPRPYLVELVGPGGFARGFGPFPTSPFDVWRHLSIPIDSSKWTMVTGTWTGLVANVNQIRFMSEFVAGDEYVRWDNIHLTFSPGTLPVDYCSDFATGYGFDGWNVINATSPTVVGTDGNLPGCIQMQDGSFGFNTLEMPARMKGDWSAFNEVSMVRFDLKIKNMTGALSLPPYLIRLKGPGGSAQIPVTAALVDSCKNRWFSFRFPISASRWTLTTGSWAALLSEVNQVSIQAEFYANTNEIVLFDNFCIESLVSVEDPRMGNNNLLVFPNPARQIAQVSTNVIAWQLFNCQGKQVGESKNENLTLNLNGLPPGVYSILLKGKTQSQVQRLVVQN
jgi:hypothetical protein